MVGTLYLLVQTQAVVILFGFFVAWHWAALRRRDGRLRLERLGTARTVYCVGGQKPGLGTSRARGGEVGSDFKSKGERAELQSKPDAAPRVHVVLPVKRRGAETERNWRTQLHTCYSGAVDYLFVVESAADEAVKGFYRLMKNLAGDGFVIRVENGTSATAFGKIGTRHSFSTPRGARRTVRMVIVGSSKSNSQKIHSMLCGVRHASENAKYVLFMDDDIRAHANTIGVSVRSMRMTRGGRPLGKSKSGNSTPKKTFLANGFPFDLPSKTGTFADYLTMVYHLVLVIAFSHGEFGKNVWGGCMMLELDSFAKNKHGLVSKYETGGYSDDLILAALCDEFGEGVACPCELVFPQRMSDNQSLKNWWNYLRRQLFVMDTYVSGRNKRINHGMLFVLSYLSFVATSGITWSFGKVFVGAFSVVLGGGLEGGTFEGAMEDVTYDPLPLLTLFAFASALSAAKAMYKELAVLCFRLGDADVVNDVHEINWVKVGIAFWITYSVVPFVAITTLVMDDVTWAGIRYRKKKGRVTRL